VLGASVQLVLDAEVWEVDRLVEVRQVVVPCPFFDLAVVTIRPSVAVGASAIVFLQPFLLLALELVVEDDAADVGALVAKPRLFAQVRAIARVITARHRRLLPATSRPG
jgi:hypothetical protein